jgi:hypothetical protein
MTTYSEMLKHPKWQKKRLEILERDNWCCVKCGDTETTLHIHHLKYTGKPWEAPKSDLVTLCAVCHSFFSTEDVKYETVNFITKLDKVYLDAPIKGYIVDTNDQTLYYNTHQNEFVFILGFRKNSKVLSTLYKINNGRR